MRFLRVLVCSAVMMAMLGLGFESGQLSVGGSNAYARRHKKKHHRKHGRKRHAKRPRSDTPEL
jgi:hypothetical protein